MSVDLGTPAILKNSPSYDDYTSDDWNSSSKNINFENTISKLRKTCVFSSSWNFSLSQSDWKRNSLKRTEFSMPKIVKATFKLDTMDHKIDERKKVNRNEGEEVK